MITNFAGRKLAETVLYPAEQPFPKTPADYGVAYRDVEFPARDGLRLSGWLLNEGRDATIIMTHFGYRANRYGYQPRLQPRLSRPYKHEIEFVRVAKRLVDAGYTVLMYDMRNHGLSAKSDSGCGTGGVDEGNDVIGAVEFVAAHDATGDRIGLLSYCMGANATFYGMAAEPETFTDNDVRALVAMQPLRNGDFLEAYGFPAVIRRQAEAYYVTKTGCSLNPEILPQIAKVPVPTLLVQGRNDPWTKLDFVDDAYAALGRDANGGAGVDKRMEWLEETEHRFDGYNWFGDHPESMLGWFDTHVGAPVAG